MGKQNNIIIVCILRVYLLMYQNAKTREYLYIWRNRKTLPKLQNAYKALIQIALYAFWIQKRALWFFFFKLVTYQKAKTCEYLYIWRNRIILRKTYCECFSLCLGTKTPKLQSTHADCFICILDSKTCVMIFFFLRS